MRATTILKVDTAQTRRGSASEHTKLIQISSCKFVVDRVLHQNAICADAGLSGIAEFTRHCSFYGGVDIGDLEDFLLRHAP